MAIGSWSPMKAGWLPAVSLRLVSLTEVSPSVGDSIFVSTRTLFAGAAFGIVTSSLPSLKVALAFERSTSAGRSMTRRISSACRVEWLCFPEGWSSRGSAFPLMVSRRGSRLTLISWLLNPGTSARAISWSPDSEMWNFTGVSSSCSARNQSSRSFPFTCPRASKISKAAGQSDGIRLVYARKVHERI